MPKTYFRKSSKLLIDFVLTSKFCHYYRNASSESIGSFSSDPSIARPQIESETIPINYLDKLRDGLFYIPGAHKL